MAGLAESLERELEFRQGGLQIDTWVSALGMRENSQSGGYAHLVLAAILTLASTGTGIPTPPLSTTSATARRRPVASLLAGSFLASLRLYRSDCRPYWQTLDMSMSQTKLDRSAHREEGPALGSPHTGGQRVQEVNGREFRELVRVGQPLVVLFGSPSCEPCHALELLLLPLADKYCGQVQVIRVNVDKQTDLGSRYKLWALPTLIRFHHGEFRRISARSASGLDQAVRQLLVDAAAAELAGGSTASRRSERTGPGLLPVSALHSGLTPFGRDIEKVGIPTCLSEHGFALEGLICRIGKNDAAGLRVGCGQVLTNRHVFEQLGGDSEGAAFVGKRPLEQPALFGYAAPAALPGRSLVMPWYVGRYADWALLGEAESSVCARPLLRSTKSLQKGEHLWLVGGSDGELDFVTVGSLKYVKGVNGILDDCDVRPGMSGSPVIDAAGQTVGIFSTQFGWPGRRAMFVTIDSIAQEMESMRPFDANLPIHREDIAP